MLKVLLLLFFVFLNLNLLAQTPVKHLLPDGTGSFTAVAPPANAKGLIVFLPGFNQSADDIFKESDFQNLAYIHGLATIFIPYGSKLYADRETIKLFNDVVKSAVEKYDVPRSKVIIGGYSSGGTIALRYAQFCLKYPASYPIDPQGVFTIEAPVDLKWLHGYFKNEIKKNFSSVGVAEAKYALSIMEKGFGGSPSDAPNRYAELSPFNMDQENGGNISILKNTPIRSYHDVNITQQLKNSRRSLLDMSVTPASEMINQLLLLGNERAELVASIDAQVNSGKTNDPNTPLSIDDKDLLIWALKCMEIPYKASYSKQPGK